MLTYRFVKKERPEWQLFFRLTPGCFVKLVLHFIIPVAFGHRREHIYLIFFGKQKEEQVPQEPEAGSAVPGIIPELFPALPRFIGIILL